MNSGRLLEADIGEIYLGGIRLLTVSQLYRIGLDWHTAFQDIQLSKLLPHLHAL